ncbi:inositol-trisphosphate 3-kinase B isoform X1 [Ictalurus furcatus]|uniref:inositol-trisphosphate 3-kinase B isoform X1 n=1 Tax=Ictalurus furcatus TaxID=66913 RepID=UPI00234FD559|nr:inositol-trisphosphate 3-kinase B isoform X1 [Ictalurus furcatus]
MSTSMDMPEEDESGPSSKAENVESMRNQLKAEVETIDEFENNCMKEALLASRRSKPKLVSAQAVLSSRLEPEIIQKELFVSASEKPEDWEPNSMLNWSETNTGAKEKDRENENTKHIAGKGGLFSGEMSRKNTWLAGQRERLRGKRRERLEGRAENIEEEDDNTTNEKEMNPGIRLRHTQRQWSSKEAQDEESEKDVTGLRGAAQRNIDVDAEMRGTVPHRIFSKVLANSFASSSSSSSSSFNYSSAESDEVFSEGEEMAKRKDVRRCRSWRTFLTMMQWSKRRQSSWIQLAGHQGNFQLGESGEVLKRFNEVEDTCLQALMSDPLHQFVPRYHGHISRNGENYIRLEDLLSGLKQPVIMDCKMGIRTYQEEEIVKARTKASIRRDMYQKMVKVDPTAPTEEEHARRGVTKLHYMQWRDSTSSTATLGFRIEGIMTENGIVQRDFSQTQSKAQVTEALLLFTKRQVDILEAYLSRLDVLKETLKESAFFRSHEVIGSSLLFVHDRPTNKANIWMIDFGKTTPVPSNVHLKHDIPWVEGNREDGYLLGLASLISLLHVAIREIRGQGLKTHQSLTEHIVSEFNQHQPGINEATTDFLKETTATNNMD